MEMDRYLIWLTSIKNIGSVRVKRLIEHFGSAKGVWEAGVEELARVKGISRELSHSIINSKNEEKIDYHIKNLEKLGIYTVDISSPLYPAFLKEIYNPPFLLYAKGNINILKARCIAVVGSRNASYYGRKVAFRLAGQLAKRGIAIVSGFARGIDSYAHKGALAVGGDTIAVLGNGLDVIYPRENYSLMKEMNENGLLLSEYTPGTSPLRANFPARNRLISGLAYGVIVVEASERSGALITADFALEQNREVFAVPGNINSPTSIGTNRLIKQGAKIVNCIEDILEELPDLHDCRKTAAVKAGKNPKEIMGGNILSLIGAQPVHIEMLIQESGMKINELNACLSQLEIEGCIEKLPGNYYVLKD